MRKNKEQIFEYWPLERNVPKDLINSIVTPINQIQFFESVWSSRLKEKKEIQYRTKGDRVVSLKWKLQKDKLKKKKIIISHVRL